jgi:hypothetical protein
MQMKSMADAVALRDRAIGLLELADITDSPERRRELLHFVVVGANFTGTEVAGELDAFLRSALPEYKRLSKSDIKITLIDHGDRILSALDEALSRYAEENLRRRGWTSCCTRRSPPSMRTARRSATGRTSPRPPSSGPRGSRRRRCWRRSACRSTSGATWSASGTCGSRGTTTSGGSATPR